MTGTTQNHNQQEDIATSLAEEQLQAYNSRNIEAFLKPYSEDIKVYQYPDNLLYTGKEKMRAVYTDKFTNLTDLHFKLINRIVLRNIVID